MANGRGMESTDVQAVGGTPFVMAMENARSDPTSLDGYFDGVKHEIEWLRSALDDVDGGGFGDGGDGGFGGGGGGGVDP